MMQNKKVIWLTGGSGSGKSMVAKFFKERGCTIIDADLISHQIMKKGTPAYKETVKAFGEGILFPDGEIDRRGLGGIIFEDSEKRAILNGITHKYIRDEIIRQSVGNGVFVVDAPLPDFGVPCDMTIVVHSDRETRIKRIMERDNIDRKYAENRIESQPLEEEYERFADIIINNLGDPEQLRKQVEQVEL